jgi:alpha-glucosidase (family GH31 glycosyl hydrolase)
MWWNAYQGYKTFNLPLDTMWGDIDYMDDYKVFTYS